MQVVRIIGIDTATAIGSVGCVESGQVVAEGSAPAMGGHSGTLAPLVRDVLAQAGWQVAGLDAVAISIGPGSFTGLRIGLSLAKGLAFAARASLVPVPTLDALAELAGAEPGELVCPMVDARKGEVYAALYGAAPGGSLTKLSDDLLIRPVDLVSRVDRRCRFLGDGIVAHGPFIERALGPAAVVLPFAEYHPGGATVARLGAARLAAGGGAPPGPLEPYYVRGTYVDGHRVAPAGPETPPGAETPAGRGAR